MPLPCNKKKKMAAKGLYRYHVSWPSPSHFYIILYLTRKGIKFVVRRFKISGHVFGSIKLQDDSEVNVSTILLFLYVSILDSPL